MDENSITTSQKVMISLIEKLGIRIEGRKKLMKLMFLIEHYDPNCPSHLTEEPFLGNHFIIYRYGVFSREVMSGYFNLGKMDILDDYPVTLLERNLHLDLDDSMKSRIDQVVSQFGNRDSSDLETYTLKLLGLTKQTKKKYFEKSVRPIIKARNTSTEPVF